MKKRIYIFIATVLIGFAGCEKVLLEKDLASSNPRENFEYLWNEADKKYSYFDLKNINWDDVKNQYSDSIFDEMSEEQLFDVLAAMLNELRDDHVNLFSPFNVSVYNVPLNYQKSYNDRTIDEHYLTEARYTGGFKHGFLDSGNVAYLRYNSFTSEVTKQDLDIVLSRYSETKGLVFDIRENGGGSIFNIPLILERFTRERKLAAYTITRNGENYTDFTEPSPFYLNQSEDGVVYNKPVVVLCDRGSYSASTFFSLLTKAFDHIKLVGDTTGGGGGLPNGGQLPNGWTYRFSVTQLLDLNYQNFAESGVPPEIYVTFNWNDLTRDEILDRAILELN